MYQWCFPSLHVGRMLEHSTSARISGCASCDMQPSSHDVFTACAVPASYKSGCAYSVGAFDLASSDPAAAGAFCPSPLPDTCTLAECVSSSLTADGAAPDLTTAAADFDTVRTCARDASSCATCTRDASSVGLCIDVGASAGPPQPALVRSWSLGADGLSCLTCACSGLQHLPRQCTARIWSHGWCT